MSIFTIDFFELMFLAEACIPPRPIARTTFWYDLCDKHYHKMSQDERERAFDWITKKDGFNLENEDCRHFFARYNPKNQFRVKCFYEGKAQKVDAYRFNERYHTARNKTINEEYIKEVEKIWIT